MAWSVILPPGFAAWIDAEADAVKARVGFALRLPRDLGPQLGRPHADTLHGAGLASLKELRVAVGHQPDRILFAFDPIPQGDCTHKSFQCNDLKNRRTKKAQN